MSRPPLRQFKLTESLSLSECHPDSECRTNNWWLHDTRAGLNIGMREETREDALVKAIEFWAKKYKKLKLEHDELQTKVDGFVQAVRPAEEEDWRG